LETGGKLKMKNTMLIFLCFTLLSLPVLNSYSDDNTHEPEPYEEDEFPVWAQKLRRAEIIMFGSIPISVLLSYLTYSFIRFGTHGWDRAYAPFGNPDKVDYSTREHIGVLITACSISISIALTDYIIGKVREKRAARENR
jgi:hypothetical protein